MKTIKFLKILLFIGIYLINEEVFYQAEKKNFNVVPPSPTVSSIGKYGDIPVGMYTGIPQILIPLYEIKSGNLTLPISLSYHSGGIKVEEIASPVGLGWSLNAGGIVGRSVRGLEDEDGGYFVQSGDSTILNIYNGDFNELTDFIEKVHLGQKDGEPDLFYYNLAGKNGKFMYDQLGNAHTVPYSRLKISTPTNLTITSEDGTLYSFQKSEEVNTENGCSGSDSFVQSAWFLTSILSADGMDSISLEYEEVTYVYSTLASETRYDPISYNNSGNCLSDSGSCLLTIRNRTHRLRKINFETGYVNFNYNNVRCDLVDDKSLDGIEIFAKNNPNISEDDELIKQYDLTYSYFGDNSDGCNRSTETNKRLKLESVEEKTLISSLPPYLFVYNTSEELPNRYSLAQDHWGFFNGELNNQSLIAKYTTIQNGTEVIVDGANREAKPIFAKAGILETITYPTGGMTKFTFEGNTSIDDRLNLPVIETQEMSLGASYYNSGYLSNPTFSANTVHIPEGGAEVKFLNVQGTYNSEWTSPGYSCDQVSFYVLKDDEFFTEIGDNWHGTTVMWEEGEYQLAMEFTCSENVPVPYFSVYVRTEITSSNDIVQNRYAGGLRIKKIENSPLGPGAPIIKEYRYESEQDSLLSSGILINYPDYGHETAVTINSGGGNGEYCNYHVRTSYSNYPLATTQGAYVGYEHIIEDYGVNGQTRYGYYTYPDIAPVFPYAPVDSHEFERGRLKFRRDFAKELSGLRKVKASHYSYSSTFPFLHFYGIKTGRNNYTVNGSGSVTGEIVAQLYELDTWSSAISSVKDTIYSSNDINRYVAKLTDYIYSDDHYQLKDITTLDSKGNLSKKTYRYAEDYGNIDNIPAMISNNIVGVPLKEENFYNGKLVSGSIKMPDIFGRPVELYSFEGDRTQPPISDDPNILLPTDYKKRHTINYDVDTGNIQSVLQEGGNPTTYIWGYNNTYPVAKIENATYSEVENVLGSGDLGPGGLQPIQAKNLRLNLSSSMVTTYTYDPLVGVTSMTDPRGYTIYYEYDDFNRLEEVRDAEGNLVTDYEYHYKGEQ